MTTYSLIVVGLETYEVGEVKIMTAGMVHGAVDLPGQFDALDKRFCSLGQGQNYYEQLAELPDGFGLKILSALRDCVADPTILEAFSAERAFEKSLLRGLNLQLVRETFRNALIGGEESSPFSFTYRAPPSASPISPLQIEVEVVPKSMPPTNVHVLIGRNGVGKTRLLAGLANALTEVDDPASMGIHGQISFLDAGRFANLVTVAFSAFDRFVPIEHTRISGDLRYTYVGLKRQPEDPTDDDEVPTVDPDSHPIKTLDELTKEFSSSLSACLTGPRRQRWIETVEILNADPGFAELELEQLGSSSHATLADAVAAFSTLSSGHKLVLLTLTRLVELVDERTLVLIDEPESHLHPPLLGSFVRAFSNLLIQRSGVGILATHSPVVLQEVPRSCVSVMRRTGEIATAERPSIETFGENVGVLTREVFRLEVTESGFHRLVAEAAKTMTYDEIVDAFGEQIGAEGRAIARALSKIDSSKSG